MGKLKTLFLLLKEDPKKIRLAIMRNFSKMKVSRCIPSKLFIKWSYRAYIGKKINLNNPETFNEKLNWLKLYDRCEDYTLLVDKFEVKEYVTRLIGDKYIIPTYGVWESFDDIDFDSLPTQFVLKGTHDSGSVVLCKDKVMFNKQLAKEKLAKSLKHNLFWHGREWPYKNVKPRIIAEKFMQDSKNADLKDYKFMCFNGKVKCSFVCSDRFTENGLHVTFFDRDWNVMPFERHYPRKDSLPKPEKYEEMIVLAEKLSKDIPFVRVDFYDVDGEIYFGELTFYPGAGFEEFTPEEWDYKLGSWIKLPDC